MQRALKVLAVAAAVALALLSAHVVSGAADAFDQSLDEAVHVAASSAVASPAWRFAFRQISWFGRGDVLTVATLLLVGAAFRRPAQRRLAFLWSFVMGGGVALLYLLKFSIGRVRPRYADPQLVEVGSLSFPSGHTMMTLVITGFALFLFLRRPRSPAARATAVGAPVIWCGLMGLSRIVLNDHYLGDVLGGYLASAGWRSASPSLAGCWPHQTFRGVDEGLAVAGTAIRAAIGRCASRHVRERSDTFPASFLPARSSHPVCSGQDSDDGRMR
jgi:undecaprenyl-diphosphatase